MVLECTAPTWFVDNVVEWAKNNVIDSQTFINALQYMVRNMLVTCKDIITI